MIHLYCDTQQFSDYIFLSYFFIWLLFSSTLLNHQQSHLTKSNILFTSSPLSTSSTLIISSVISSPQTVSETSPQQLINTALCYYGFNLKYLTFCALSYFSPDTTFEREFLFHSLSRSYNIG